MVSTAKDIMTTGAITVTPDMSLLDAAKILNDHDFAGIPVVDKEGVLAGILTEYDIISKSPKDEMMASLTVHDAMNTDPIIFQENAPLEEVLGAFKKHHRVNPVPVVDSSRKVVGIVSRYDIVKVMIASTAHQLSAPLTAIGWSAESLLRGAGGKLSAEQREFVEEMHNQARSLQDTVNLFLNVTRLESGIFNLKPTQVRLSEVAEDLFKTFESFLLKKNLKFTKSCDENSAMLDERIFRVVLQNLLSNAIRYTPDGGAINVEVKKLEDKVLIRVTDTGLGISLKEQPKIFSHSFRTEEAKNVSSEGTGLGLYLAKMMVEKIGGKIWFESPASPSASLSLDGSQSGEEGKGSIFSVEMPVA